MSEQHEQTGQLHEAEEVFDVVLPSGDQPAVVLHPGKEPFNLPPAPVAAQRSAVLRLLPPVGSVGRDHFDLVFLHLLVQRVRVVGLVANQSFGQFVEEASGQNSFHKPALGRRRFLQCGVRWFRGLNPHLAGEPRAVAVDRHGNVYIADSYNNRVVRVPRTDLACATPGDCTLVPFPTSNSNGAPTTPVSVAVDRNFNVYVGYTAKDNNGGVVKVLPNVRTCSAADCITVATNMESPTGIAVDRSGNVYIVDDNIKTKVFLEEPGSFGGLPTPILAGFTITPTPGLARPWGIALDGKGNLYISVSASNVLLKENPSGVPTSGCTYQETKIGPKPGPPIGLSTPNGLASDRRGNLYVAYWGLSNDPNLNTESGVLKAPRNDPTCKVASDCPMIGSGINGPIAVAVDSQGNVYISDSVNGVLKVRQPSACLGDGKCPFLSSLLCLFAHF